MERTYQAEQAYKINAKLNAMEKEFPNFATDFFIGISNNTAPRTRLNYARDLAFFFKYLANKKFNCNVQDITIADLNTLNAIDIEKFLNYISSYENFDGTKIVTNGDVTKSRKLSAIRSLMRYLFDHDLIDSDVSAKVKTFKKRSKEIIRLEYDEVSKLLDQAESPTKLSKMEKAFNKKTHTRDLAILGLLLGTGIRVSECVGIDITDIDFENNAFKVTRKGGGKSILYFSSEVRRYLLDWIKDRNSWLDEPNENALFLSMQKKRIDVRSIQKLVKKYASAVVPLKKITPHKLRSTYGTNLYRETKDIYIVAEVLGHKDVNTTKTHYAAIGEDIRRDVADKVKLR